MNTIYDPRIHGNLGEVLTDEWETTPDAPAATTVLTTLDLQPGQETTGQVVTQAASDVAQGTVAAVQSIPGIQTLENSLVYIPWILGGILLFTIYIYVSSYGRATARITHPLG